MYVGEDFAQQQWNKAAPGGHPDRPRRQRECVMFEPKQSTSASLVCIDNQSKEFAYLLNHEYNEMRERQELKLNQAELLKAKE